METVERAKPIHEAAAFRLEHLPDRLRRLFGMFGAPIDLFAGLGFVAVFAAASNTSLACTIVGWNSLVQRTLFTSLPPAS